MSLELMYGTHTSARVVTVTWHTLIGRSTSRELKMAELWYFAKKKTIGTGLLSSPRKLDHIRTGHSGWAL
jgi:hypothetical protein